MSRKVLIFCILIPLVYCGEREEAKRLKTQEEILGNKYAFLLFEDIETCKVVYKQEHILVQKLQDLRKLLVETKEKIKDAPTVKKYVENVKVLKDEIDKETFELPKNEEELIGATKGMLILLYAYPINITASVLHGELQYLDTIGIQHSFPSYERLKFKDLQNFVSFAFEQHNYQLASDILRQVFQMEKFIPSKKLLKSFQTYRENVMKLSNGYLMKTEKFVDKNFVSNLGVVDNKLKLKKKQPDFVTNGKLFNLNIKGDRDNEWFFMTVCKLGQFLPPYFRPEHQCRFLHHGDPYLKLGPFKEEKMVSRPYVVIFHDILSDKEIDYLVEETRPNLSRKRDFSKSTSTAYARHELKGSKKRRIVQKTVQAWIDEADWDPIAVDNYTLVTDYNKINHEVLWKLAYKIKLATKLQTQKHLSGSAMQVTNYGLGGLCEVHIDPHGYIEGAHTPPDREHLKLTGDMIGTFMAWLSNCEAGGGTAYAYPGTEGVILPQKGAAAFWYDLTAKGHRDLLTRHGGCPVLKGSKWILNKWMYYYDNFKEFPCQLQENQAFDEPAKHDYFRNK